MLWFFSSSDSSSVELLSLTVCDIANASPVLTLHSELQPPRHRGTSATYDRGLPPCLLQSLSSNCVGLSWRCHARHVAAVGRSEHYSTGPEAGCSQEEGPKKGFVMGSRTRGVQEILEKCI